MKLNIVLTIFLINRMYINDIKLIFFMNFSKINKIL